MTFAVEIVIWWIPYFTIPSGPWRRGYNVALAWATSNFEKGDTLERWILVHRRIHSGTLTLVKRREGRITPNLERLGHGCRSFVRVRTSNLNTSNLT